MERRQLATIRSCILPTQSLGPGSKEDPIRKRLPIVAACPWNSFCAYSALATIDIITLLRWWIETDKGKLKRLDDLDQRILARISLTQATIEDLRFGSGLRLPDVFRRDSI